MKSLDRDAAADVASMVALRQLLHRLDVELAQAIRINLDAVDLTPEDWAVMCLLADGGAHAMADVIAAAGVPAPSATRLVDRLVSSALVHRAADPEDRRRVLVALSPRGREQYERLLPGQARVADMVLRQIGPAQASALLSDLAEAVDSLVLD